MSDNPSDPNVDAPGESILEETVQSALNGYALAVESAHTALASFGDQGVTNQSELDRISGVIAVVEDTQIALFSALRSVGRPVPASTHRA